MKQPAQAETLIDETAQQAGPQKKPSPQQVNKIATQSFWKLPTSLTFDLGDVHVGRRTPWRFPIFCGGNQTPRIEAKLTGDPAIRLVNAPMSLPTGSQSQPYSGTNDFHLEIRPEQEGHLKSTLDVWVTDSPRELHQFPITVAAHLPGGPTLKEQEKSDRERAEIKKKDDGDAAKQQKADKAIEKYLQEDHHHHSGAMEKLTDAQTSIHKGVERVLRNRKIGVDTIARTEVGNFVRKQKKADYGLLYDLAASALNIATAGIGAALAKRLEPHIKRLFTKFDGPSGFQEGPIRQIVPSDTVVAFFTETVKSSVKEVGGGAIKAGRARVDSPNAVQSDDALAAYWGAQDLALEDDHAKRSEGVGTRMRFAVLPLMQSQPGAKVMPPRAQGAIDDLHAIAQAVESEAGHAANTQAHESVRSWVRYLAYNNMHNADARGRQDDSIDGLIDLTFAADQANPQAPIRVTHVRFNGVRRAVMNRFLSDPISTLGLPMRASARLSPEQSLIILRNERGQIRYTDIPRQAGSWFAKRAGVRTHPYDVDRERGAHMVAEELASRSIAMHVVSGAVDGMLENDSDE